jgi:hypothetical protein
MKIFVVKSDGVVFLRARLVDDETGTVGDYQDEVRPGQAAFGKTYEEWRGVETPSVDVE